MITIDNYTGEWQAALNPTPPRSGQLVRIHVQPDAREYDDFHRTLKKAGLVCRDWVRYMPRLKLDVYRLERAGR